MQKKTNCCHRKQYKQHKHQQNKNNEITKMGRKTTVWTFSNNKQAKSHTKKLDMVDKRKP